MIRSLPLAIAMLLAFSLPFELDTPWLQVGPIAFTNVELLLVALLVSVGALTRPLRRPPLIWMVLLGAFGLSGLITVAFAQPELRTNALKAALRTLMSMSAGLAVYQAVRSSNASRALVLSILGGVCVAAVLGMVEFMSGDGLVMLQRFRPKPSLAGPFMRLTGPYDYANQTAVAFEAALLLSVGLFINYRSRLLGWLALALATFCQIALVLTFSRAALLTVIAVAAVLAIASMKRLDLRAYAAALAFVIIVPTIVTLIFSQTLRLRLTTQSEQIWYRNTIDAPKTAVAQAGEPIDISLAVANLSPRDWSSDGLVPINLGARIIGDDGGLVLEPRWSLEQPLASNERRSADIVLIAPREAGIYTLHWDFVEEEIAWFEQMSGQSVVTALTVKGVASAEIPQPSPDANAAAAIFIPPDPSRLTLWKVGLQLWQASPMFGIGLDNFRLSYGPELDFPEWNTTLHSNNWYVETLVSVGIIGAVPFFIWIATLAVGVGRRLLPSESHQPTDVLPTAIGLALGCFLVHGLLDYFLLFNAISILFWMLAGLWLAITQEEFVR